MRSCTNSRSMQACEEKLPPARQKIAGILCVFQDFSTKPGGSLARKDVCWGLLVQLLRIGRGLSEWTGPSVRRKRLCLFRREKLRPHARTRCPPEAANSHTVRPGSVFPDAHVAGENGFHFLRACGRELCEAFSTSSDGTEVLPRRLALYRACLQTALSGEKIVF